MSSFALRLQGSLRARQLVEQVGEVVGGREHGPMAGVELVETPVGRGEGLEARVAARDQFAQRGRREAAFRADDPDSAVRSAERPVERERLRKGAKRLRRRLGAELLEL